MAVLHRIDWCRAFVISGLVHLLILSSLGWLAGGLFITPEPEEYVELELFGEIVAVEQIREDNPVSASKIEAVPTAKPQVAQVPDTITPAVATTTVAMTVDVAESASTDVGSAAVPAESSSRSLGDSNPSVTKAQSRGPRTISPPRILQKIEPRYPEQARRDGVQGTVLIKMQILENGQSGEAWVQHSSGYASLDDAALHTVQNWRFMPARDEDSGQAIRCYTVLTVEFRLN